MGDVINDIGMAISNIARRVRRLETLAKNSAYYESLTGGGHTIQDEGVALQQRGILNFVGASVVASDDPVNESTLVTISGGGGWQSGAHVSLDNGGTNIAINDHAFTDLEFDTVEYDTDGYFDGTSALVAPASGVYSIGAYFGWHPDGGTYDLRAWFELNDSDNIQTWQQTMDTHWQSGLDIPVLFSTVMYLNLADYIKVVVYQTDAASNQINSYSPFGPSMWMQRIG